MLQALPLGAPSCSSPSSSLPAAQLLAADLTRAQRTWREGSIPSKAQTPLPIKGAQTGLSGPSGLGRRQRLGPGWAFGVNLPSCVCPGIGLLQAHQEGLGSGTQAVCSAHSTELSLYLHVLSLDYGLHALPFPDSKTKVLKSRDVPAEVEPQHLRTERAMQVSLSEPRPHPHHL